MSYLLLDGTNQKNKDIRSGPRIRPNRMKVSSDIPTEEVLAAIKHKKKVDSYYTECIFLIMIYVLVNIYD